MTFSLPSVSSSWIRVYNSYTPTLSCPVTKHHRPDCQCCAVDWRRWFWFSPADRTPVICSCSTGCQVLRVSSVLRTIVASLVPIRCACGRTPSGHRSISLSAHAMHWLAPLPSILSLANRCAIHVRPVNQFRIGTSALRRPPLAVTVPAMFLAAPTNWPIQTNIWRQIKFNHSIAV